MRNKNYLRWSNVRHVCAPMMHRSAQFQTPPNAVDLL